MGRLDRSYSLHSHRAEKNFHDIFLFVLVVAYSYSNRSRERVCLRLLRYRKGLLIININSRGGVGWEGGRWHWKGFIGDV